MLRKKYFEFRYYTYSRKHFLLSQCCLIMTLLVSFITSSCYSWIIKWTYRKKVKEQQLLQVSFYLTWLGSWHLRHLSNLPGRSRAGSIKSGRLVAASTYTPLHVQYMYIIILYTTYMYTNYQCITHLGMT